MSHNNNVMENWYQCIQDKLHDSSIQVMQIYKLKTNGIFNNRKFSAAIKTWSKFNGNEVQ